MITEDYVSFEIAKLLKERGFDEPCYAYWPEDENRLIISQSMHAIQNITNPCFFGSAAPTLQMAMKWLREVHNVNIEIPYNRFGKNYKYLIIYKPEVLDDIRSLGVFYHYEEAAETAIKYCLKNLI